MCAEQRERICAEQRARVHKLSTIFAERGWGAGACSRSTVMVAPSGVLSMPGGSSMQMPTLLFCSNGLRSAHFSACSEATRTQTGENSGTIKYGLLDGNAAKDSDGLRSAHFCACFCDALVCLFL